MDRELLKSKLEEKLYSLHKKKKNDFCINEWICIDEISANIYVRFCTRIIDERRINCIDRANTSIDEKFTGKGYYSDICKVFEKVAKELKLLLYVESVLNDIVEQKLKKEGYIKYPFSNSYYKDYSNG
jgi:hypothetical protein